MAGLVNPDVKAGVLVGLMPPAPIIVLYPTPPYILGGGGGANPPPLPPPLPPPAGTESRGFATAGIAPELTPVPIAPIGLKPLNILASGCWFPIN